MTMTHDCLIDIHSSYRLVRDNRATRALLLQKSADQPKSRASDHNELQPIDTLLRVFSHWFRTNCHWFALPSLPWFNVELARHTTDLGYWRSVDRRVRELVNEWGVDSSQSGSSSLDRLHYSEFVHAISAHRVSKDPFTLCSVTAVAHPLCSQKVSLFQKSPTTPNTTEGSQIDTSTTQLQQHRWDDARLNARQTPKSLSAAAWQTVVMTLSALML